MTIGCDDTTGYPEAVDGYLNEVDVWQTALTTTEVAQLYNNGIGIVSNNVSSYPAAAEMAAGFHLTSSRTGPCPISPGIPTGEHYSAVRASPTTWVSRRLLPRPTHPRSRLPAPRRTPTATPRSPPATQPPVRRSQRRTLTKRCSPIRRSRWRSRRARHKASRWT